jgi:general L-amino acid transport system substrate-binding protein
VHNAIDRHVKAILSLLTLALSFAGPVTAQTLKAVKERGALVCGVSQGLMGFSYTDQKGDWTGFDVDLCRAIAAAIFDDTTKIRFTPLDAGTRFAVLASGDIDVLSRNSTWTLSRETSHNLLFAAVTYFDGQGFLVPKSLKVDSALELNTPSICVQKGTTTELNVADYFGANNIRYDLVSFVTLEEARVAYDQGRCTVFTSDISALHAVRLTLNDVDAHIILPEIISKEPLGPVVRQGDDKWLNIVKWTHYAMVNAEELGISSTTLEQGLKSEKSDVKRLLGTDGNFGEQLGLSNDWATRIIRHVGNYGDVFERNVGMKTALSIPRGINQLWNNGGILYAPPIR